jgi:putative nucleotidyltransferase with HDIG domain
MLKRIPVDELRTGMHVEDIGMHWIDAPYLYSRTGPIGSSREIESIKRQGYKYAYIDPEKGIPVEGTRSGIEGLGQMCKAAPDPAPVCPEVPFEEELTVAAKVYADALLYVRRLLAGFVEKGPALYEEARPHVDALLESVIRNQNALLTLSKLREHDQYTYTHCVNVAALSMIVGRHQGLPREEQILLGTAGLFHDIGKEHIPRHILGKPGSLTDAEYRIVRRHPEEGYAIMRGVPGISGRILRVILEHHEKHNGTGYPARLSGDQIDQFSGIVSMADIYDALTSDRIYRKSVVMQRALQILFAMRGEELRADLVEQFVKCMGVYPPGSFVRLSNGVYGVVTEVDTERLLLPKVRVILDGGMLPVKPRLIDLARLRRTGVDALRIDTCLDPRAFGVDMAQALS